MRFQDDDSNASQVNAGMAIYPFLRHFDKTFHMSGAEVMQQFCRRNVGVRRWLLFSDYAFHDPKKENDAATFTFIPYTKTLDKLSAEISAVAPRDIKDSPRVNPSFIDLIQRYPTFSVSVVLDRSRRLSEKEREELKQDLVMLRRMVNTWEPRAAADYETLSKDIGALLNKLSSVGVNMEVVRDLIIVSYLAAYLVFEFHKVSNSERIAWCSDRDDMLSFLGKRVSCSPMHMLAHVLLHSIAEQNGVDSDHVKFDLAVPNKEGPLWYDAPLRIPDLICGTLADIKGEPCVASHEKFHIVMERLLGDEHSQLIFNIKFDKDTGAPLASRWVYTVRPA